MNCQYCGKEMELGVISSRHEIAWVKGEKKPVLNASFHPGSVVLSKLSFTNGSAVAAYLCRDCQKVVIDYSNKYSDYNAR